MPHENLEATTPNIEKEKKQILALVAPATAKSKERIPAKHLSELIEKNPELFSIIEMACDSLKVDPVLLITTLRLESEFRHNLEGDKHMESPSIGIGQFRPGTWKDLWQEKNPPFKEFRLLVNAFYPGQKFDRGENLLVDVIASAAYLKYLAGKKVDMSKGISTGRALYIRARYKGDGRASALKKEYQETGKTPPTYTKFTKFYRKYRKQYREHKKEIAQL